MSIGILETGRPPESLLAKWGSYDAMMRTMLGAGRAYRSYDVQAGVLPERADECSAYVITGSSAGVYDPLPWIAPLLAFLRAARGRAKMVGVCFGHQAMAQAFGGEVIQSPKGWGVGLHGYRVVAQAPWMDPVARLSIPAFHQDQVVSLPPGARVLAASDFTPFAALAYGEEAVSIQPHPEFSAAFSIALIDAKPRVYGSLAGPARRSLEQPGAWDQVGRWLQRFLDQPRGLALP